MFSTEQGTDSHELGNKLCLNTECWQYQRTKSAYVGIRSFDIYCIPFFIPDLLTITSLHLLFISLETKHTRCSKFRSESPPPYHTDIFTPRILTIYVIVLISFAAVFELVTKLSRPKAAAKETRPKPSTHKPRPFYVIGKQIKFAFFARFYESYKLVNM